MLQVRLKRKFWVVLDNVSLAVEPCLLLLGTTPSHLVRLDTIGFSLQGGYSVSLIEAEQTQSALVSPV